MDIPYFLATSIEEVIKNDLTDMEVLVHRGPELKLEGKLPNFIGVVLRASGPIQVFGARFTSKGKEKQSGKVQIGIRHFVYAGGTYRFVRFFETQCVEEAAPATVNPQGQPTSLKRIRIGGNVAVAKLIRTVSPAYPAAAKQARIQGTVRLQVLISRQGCIKEVEVLNGHPLLAQAAQDAVRGWMYQPTLINGELVEVVSTVDVVFTLSGR